MIMEPDKLQSLFNNFNPDMANSGENFMARLERNLRSVEVVKNQLVKDRRRNRLALVLSTAIGFIFGIIATIIYPSITQLVENISHTSVGLPSIPESYINTITLAMLGIIGLLLTFTVYDITRAISLKSPKA